MLQLTAMTPQYVTAVGLLGILVVLLGGYFGYSKARRWREQSSFAKAQELSRRNDYCGAVRAALRAEAAWRLSPGPATQTYGDDLSRLIDIHRLIRRQMSALGTGLDLYELDQAVNKLRKLCSSEDNFAWDKRTMKPDTALVWQQTLDQLARSRATLRGVCEQTLKRGVSHGSL